jgi:hypothetical protein
MLDTKFPHFTSVGAPSIYNTRNTLSDGKFGNYPSKDTDSTSRFRSFGTSRRVASPCASLLPIPLQVSLPILLWIRTPWALSWSRLLRRRVLGIEDRNTRMRQIAVDGGVFTHQTKTISQLPSFLMNGWKK